MRKYAVLGLLMIAACGSQGTVAVVSPTATTSASNSASPSALSSPTPVASTPPQPAATPVGLNVRCRLPVVWITNPANPTQHAGFLSFPGQSLTEDRSAPAGSRFYDRAFARWLPVWRDAVSPDGAHYAYTKTDPSATSGTVHVVDVATGVDKAIYTGGPMEVVEYGADGIYLTNGYEVPIGLWLENPEGGQPRIISSTILFPRVTNGAAWGVTFNSADPDPASGGMTGPQNELLRIDLVTGASSAWWYQPGQDLRVMDADYSGDLFVQEFRESTTRVSTWAVTAPKTAQLVYDDTNGTADLGPDNVAAVDANGTWFDAGGGSVDGPQTTPIWLFAGGRIKEIAVVRQFGVVIAGGCIPA